jgi:hypothetical protein
MEPCLSTAQVRLWGGVECTVNRIGDQYFNQLDVSGHSSRLEVSYCTRGIRPSAVELGRAAAQCVSRRLMRVMR